MTDATSIPGPAAGDSASGPAQPQQPPCDNGAALSDEDVLALLDSLGVPGTHDPEEDQNAIAAAEWEALRDCDDDGGRDGGHGTAGGPGRTAGGRAVSPVLIGEHLPAGPGLAAVLASGGPAGASDWDLPGLAAGYRKLAAWAQACELAAAAEIAARRAAANPKIGTDEAGRPTGLPPEAAAEVALELSMSQPGASAWTALGCQLRWDLPATGAALAAGRIDLPRARIIAEATTWLTAHHAAAVEARVLPRAGRQTTAQLRAAVRRAVLAIDPEGAEQRRRDTERSAKISLYPGEEGTATVTGSCLPGIQAAAAMARITAMARALKSSGAHGGLDLLRANIYLGLLLGTLPHIPPPADGPPDNPTDGDGPTDDGSNPTDDGSTATNSSPAPDRPDSSTHGDGRPAGIPGDGGTPPHAEDGRRGHRDAPASPPAGRASPNPSTGRGAAGGRGADGGGQHPGAAQDPDDASELPGWWPGIPPPTDDDAPPDDGDPPGPVTGPTYESDDEDWPQLPPPDWPPMPPQLPATPGPAPKTAGDGSGRAPARPGATGLLDVLIPWTSLAGHSREPAILGRIGPITSWQARQLAALATRSPATQWRVIITGDDGRALAVQRARPPCHARATEKDSDGTGTGAPVTGVVGRVTITIRASTLGAPDATPGPDTPLTVQHIAPTVLGAAARAAARAHAEAAHDADARSDAGAGGRACAHAMASDSYRPPPRIREHVAARDCTCRFGPCGQPAWRTDLDHTVPWHRGGPTCPCNLGGCCRTHHKIKQLPGWHLDQPQPGTFRWTTPAGRSYQVTPDRYPF